jgi:hypothetical protein
VTKFRLCCTLAFAGANLASAQAASLVRIGAGSEQVAQKNPAASPYVYAGFGWTGFASFSRASERRTLQADLSFGGAPLHSGVTGSDAKHLAIDLSLRDLHPLGVGTWMIGGVFAGSLEGSSHNYSLYHTRNNFGYLRFSVGPAVRTRWQADGKLLANDLQVPLISLIDFPYADAKSNGDGLRFTVAGPWSLQSVDESLSMRIRGGLVFTYHVSALRYRLGEPRVFARQSLSLGFERGDSRP